MTTPPPDSMERGALASKRRRYVERRAQRTAVPDKKAEERSSKKRWAIDEARTALDPNLTVPQAAIAVGRTASAVESLRLRWRTGKLPAALAEQIPPPPRDQTR